MAHTPEGKKLTEKHRKAQIALNLSLTQRLKDLFLNWFKVSDIDASSKEFVRHAVPVVLAHRDLSAQKALEYVDAFRRVEVRGLLDPSDLTPDLADPRAVSVEVLEEVVEQGILEDEDADAYMEALGDELPAPDRVIKELYVTAVATSKKEIAAGKTEQEARDAASTAVQAKGKRIVADGGRAPLLKEVREGVGAVGYARVVDPDPCPFCAMLASRGAVYRSDAFAASTSLFTGDGDFKVHDGCECTLEPIYGRSLTELPPGSEELSKEWAEIAAGQPNPWAAWRRYKRSGTKPGEERSNAEQKAMPSAPQYGRERARAQRKKTGASGRRKLDDMDMQQLVQTMHGMRIRRAGLESDLAALEMRGQTPDEPGPAQQIARQLERVEKQLAHGQALIAKMKDE